MKNEELSETSKIAGLSHSNFNSYRPSTNNKINKDALIEISNEQDLISYKIKRRHKRALLKKSITATIKYEFKSSNASLKKNNNKINRTKNKKSSTILRNQSNILNNRPLDRLFNKSIIKRGQRKNNKSKEDQKNQKETIDSFPLNKWFKNFNLNKVCGSSHPFKEEKIENNNKGNNLWEYKYIKSYTLKYNYKEEKQLLIDENNKENIDKLLNKNNNMNNNINNNINIKNNINNNINYINNIKKNLCEKKEKLLILPESSEKKIKKELENHKSLSSNNSKIKFHTIDKIDDINKIMKDHNTITYHKFFENKSNLEKQIKNFKLEINSKKQNKFYEGNEKNKTNTKIFDIDFSLNNYKHRRYFFRNSKNLFDNNNKFSKNMKTNLYSIYSKENKYENNNKYMKNHNYNKVFRGQKILDKKDSKIKDFSNIFNNKTVNLINKYGSNQNSNCIMPANNLSNINIKNQKEYLF